jgi:hypothetical protein
MKYIISFTFLLLTTCTGIVHAQSLFNKVRNANPYYHRQDSLRNLFQGHGYAEANAAVKARKFPASPHAGKGNSNSFTAATCNTYFCRRGVVPVTGMELSGVRTDNAHVMLNWKTYSELNNAGFDIERSFTGQSGSFEYTGFVSGAGYSNAALHYAKQDNNTFKGISYYRLKQKDLDGHFTYSNVAAVKGYSTAPELKIYPNPGTNASALFYISGLDDQAKVSITITDAPGRILLQKNNFTLQNGATYLSRLINLPAGFYTVSFSNEAIRLRGSFVITY